MADVNSNSPLKALRRTSLLLPLINIESDFSLVFGGLFLTGAALYVVYRLAIAAGLMRRLPRRAVAMPDPGVRAARAGASTMQG